MINSTGYTKEIINSTQYDVFPYITAGDTVITAGSTVVNAMGIDTSREDYKSGNIFIKSTDWTRT